jgi:hypothetical protein
MRGSAFWVLLLPCLAAAQVYKWVDANGVTHYGEQPPASVRSREIKLRDSGPKAAGESAPLGNAGTYKERELEFRRRQAQREVDEARLAQERAVRDRQCGAARLSLADLRTVGKLYDLNERGERVWMSDTQRDSEIARREAEYNRKCG